MLLFPPKTLLSCSYLNTQGLTFQLHNIPFFVLTILTMRKNINWFDIIFHYNLWHLGAEWLFVRLPFFDILFRWCGPVLSDDLYDNNTCFIFLLADHLLIFIFLDLLKDHLLAPFCIEKLKPLLADWIMLEIHCHQAKKQGIESWKTDCLLSG